MDKLIERLQYELHCLDKGGRQYLVVADAITALTQDRAAVLPEGWEIVTHNYGKDFIGIVHKESGLHGGVHEPAPDAVYRERAFWKFLHELRALQTPPATQAEPKVYERKNHPAFGTYMAPDTRNQAVADRRLTKLGKPIIAQERCTATRFGRRAGDGGRRVDRNGADDPLGGACNCVICKPTPQPAAEVSLEQWVQKRWSKVGMATTVVAYDLQEFAAELDKRERGS